MKFLAPVVCVPFAPRGGLAGGPSAGGLRSTGAVTRLRGASVPLSGRGVRMASVAFAESKAFLDEIRAKLQSTTDPVERAASLLRS